MPVVIPAEPHRWHDDAWKNYLYWQTQDKKTLRRINMLLKDIERNPYDDIGETRAAKAQSCGLVEMITIVWSTHTRIDVL